MAKDSFYITTPIYYVNDKPHIGHSYTTILGDVLARYHRLLGVDTYFLTGTDEHGQKVQRAADAGGITPQAHADAMVQNFQALWKKLEITHDDYIRTTEDRHKTIVQAILQGLYDKGEIYRDEYDGWYCVSDERFFTEKDLVDGNCPECGRPVEQIKEANYFFKMSNYQDWLIQYINDNPEFIQPDFRRNETLGFLRQPLNDLCISRPKKRLSWGIDLPFDKDFVCYVWFDALVNYISAIGYLKDEKEFNRWWPVNYHLIGKDILTTHTVYWPTMLKAMGVAQPKTIFAHGWWLYGDAKMSKTDGNVVDPMEMIDKYGVDAFRYYLSAEMTVGQDASFSEESFIKRYNSDLANDLGNLLSRVLNMIGRYCDGKIPEPEKNVLKKKNEKDLWKTVQGAVTDLQGAVDTMKLDAGVGKVLGAVRAINKYLEVKQPWTQAKADDQAPLHTTLYTAAEGLRVTSALLHPVMPEKMTALRNALGLEDAKPDTAGLTEWGRLAPGSAIGKAEALFPRIETDKKKTDKNEKKSQKKKEKPMEAEVEADALISYDDFSKVELQTAVIVEAEKIEDADKLLKIQVLAGQEKRQIVAGIAQHYEPDDLIGKTVVIVANLKPAKIRGTESSGMLLAASRGETLRLVTIDGDMSSGAGVK